MGSDTYTIPDDVMAAELEGEAVLLHLNTKRYYRLNATAAAVWKGIQANLDRAALLEELAKQFEFDPATAESDLDRLLGDLLEKGLIAT